MNDIMQGMRRGLIALAGGAIVLALAAQVQAQVAPVTVLDTYLTDLDTWSADFTQTVVDANGKRLPEADGSGRLVIVRPGKFRWESRPGDAREVAQLMVADGRDLWFLDHDLEQVTVKSLKDAPPQSPVMLLAGGTGLRQSFDVTTEGRRDGHEWVKVRPKQAESDFREALFGFSNRELTRMVLVDKLGQRSTMGFRSVRRNAAVDPELVTFTPPEGVDVIGKPTAGP